MIEFLIDPFECLKRLPKTSSKFSIMAFTLNKDVDAFVGNQLARLTFKLDCFHSQVLDL